eukprot:752300-Hanusia_phi.AAC.7
MRGGPEGRKVVEEKEWSGEKTDRTLLFEVVTFFSRRQKSETSITGPAEKPRRLRLVRGRCKTSGRRLMVMARSTLPCLLLLIGCQIIGTSAQTVSVSNATNVTEPPFLMGRWKVSTMGALVDIRFAEMRNNVGLPSSRRLKR